MLRHFRFVLVITAPLALLAAGRSKPAEPLAAQPAVEQPAAQAPAAPTADVKSHMDDHFARVREIEEAVIRGDLDAAKAPARWIADHQESAGLPAGAAPQIAAMKTAAAAVANAKDVPAAASGAASLVTACGDCHTASKVTPTLPAAVMPAAKDGKAAHMASHQHAVDLMYRGLVAPSDRDWKKGAEALKAAPLGGKALPEAKDAIAAEAKVHALAERALKAADRPAKAAVYGDVIGGCASCHGLHGRVWGPGAPKTE